MIKAIVIGAGALALATASLIHASSEVHEVRSPFLELPRTSLTAQAVERLAHYGMRSQLDPQTGRVAGEMDVLIVDAARDSFAVDPLAVSSIRTLAYAMDGEGQTGEAARLLGLASQLSQRDLLTNLWLAQNAIQQNDVDGTIGYLDNALSTNLSVRDRIMAPLLNLMNVEGGQEGIALILRDRPIWEPDFWEAFSKSEPAAPFAVSFLRDSGLGLDRMSEKQKGQLYSLLRRTERYGDLYALAELDSSASPDDSALRSGSFNEAEGANLFGWQLVSTGNFSARIPRGGSDLVIDARANSLGSAATRIFRTDRDGTLRIAMRSAVPDDTTVRLDADCLGGARAGQELASIELETGEQQGSAAIASQGCDFARLDLRFTVGNVVLPTEISVRSIAFD